MYYETLIISSPYKEFQKLVGTKVGMVTSCKCEKGEYTKVYLIFTPYNNGISNILGNVYLSVKIYNIIADNKIYVLKTDIGEFVLYKHE